MEEPHSGTTSEDGGGLPPILPDSMEATCDHPSIGINPAVTLCPGQTLVIHHPHSQYPAHIIPTAELHHPCEHVARCDVGVSEASYAPFPTRADFEQAEIFVNNNCSDKFINAQLKFACRNGMRLGVRSSREMHQLLACGVDGDLTGSSKVRAVYHCMRSGIAHKFLQFRQEEIIVPYVQGQVEDNRTYIVRYRPAMDAILRTIEDPDLQGVLTMYPQQHYVCDPNGNQNMRVFTDVHTADDWWSLQVHSLYGFPLLF